MSTPWQAEDCRGILLAHEVQLARGKPSCGHELEECREAVRVEGIARLTEIARHDAVLGADRTYSFRVIPGVERFVCADQRVVDKLQLGPHPGGPFHLFDIHSYRL